MLRRSLLMAPLAAAGLGGVAFWSMLRRMADGRFDPHGVPSPLVGHAAPDFTLPALAPHPGFDGAALRSLDIPVLVNFFASWCMPCLQEAGALATLAHSGVPVWGIAYKDQPEATTAFLHRTGNPFARLVCDRAGQVAIDWGVTGVPESFVIDRHGIVRWHWAGPLTDPVIESQLRPVLRRAAA